MRSVITLLLVGGWLGFTAGDSRAHHVTDTVTFPSLETYPGASAIDLGEVTGIMTRPDNAGPHRAVVMLHGCGGLNNKHKRWAQLFAAWGYASLRIDSFSPRGIDEICTDIRQAVPRAADINGAIAYLKTLNGIDTSEIVIVGWSHGASVTLQALAMPSTLRPDLLESVAGGVAIYPYCHRGSQAFAEPLLVLIGSADEWTPAGLCESMVERLPASSEPVDLVIYEGATHSYDCMVCNGVYYGHLLVFDEPAYEDSARRVEEFLAANLFNN